MMKQTTTPSTQLNSSPATLIGSDGEQGLNRLARQALGKTGHKLAIVLSALFVVAPVLLAGERQTIILDGKQAGRGFEGIGACSAGASSRLLIDYAEPYRTQILNYLFKPNYGAGFQHLKVEIGGDMNSTDGCEPSHQHSRDDVNYQRGYEWWLMKEARKRNSDIYLDCLEWGAPAWIGDGKFYSQDNADYIVKFLQGARMVHGLELNYVGIWNETNYDADWIILLRRTLDKNQLRTVQIVAADQINTWNIVESMATNAELHKAVQVVGVHYPKYRSTPAAQKCGKPLWSSEDGPWDGTWAGAVDLAKTYNRNYINGKMTKTIIWSPVTSYYDNLPLPGSGVMRANTPWSGHYEVQPALWATAHTTQFAAPGWKYLEGGACGYLAANGSYVTLQSPNGSDYSIIVETLDAARRKDVTFRLAGGLSLMPVQVWRSDAQEQFVRANQVIPTNGVFQIAFDPGCIYSLTTTTGQRKGDAIGARPAPFPAPYREDFESYAPGATPRYFSDQAGIFEVVRRPDSQGNSLRQVVDEKGIEWHYHANPFPETFLGSTEWTDYEVSVEVLLEKGGFASLFGRVYRIPQNANPPDGYWLVVDHSGAWGLSAGATPIATGKAAFSPETWHTLKLSFMYSIVQVSIDGAAVAELIDGTYAYGMVGLGCGWHTAQFDNLLVRPMR